MAENVETTQTQPLLTETQTTAETQTVETQETQQPVVQQEISESEHESEEEEYHTGPHLPVAVPHPVWTYTQSLGFQALLWIQFLWNIMNVLSAKTVVVSKSVLRGIQSKTYVFFQDSNYPYRVQDTVIAGPGIAPVEWFYDADTKLFLASNLYNTTTEYTTHHFQWLTGEVKYNDLVLYDITEFLEGVKWAGTTKPSPARVLSAWALHSGIVLNGKDGLSLHTINEDGSESNIPFRV